MKNQFFLKLAVLFYDINVNISKLSGIGVPNISINRCRVLRYIQYWSEKYVLFEKKY